MRDQLRQSMKGASFVAEFTRYFKGFCDQLATIGHPIDDSEKLHWFLCGLGPSFETFSSVVRTTQPMPSFRNLLAQAESHKLFLKSLHGSTHTIAAFSAVRPSIASPNKPRTSIRSLRGGSQGGPRHSNGQLCRTDGHYVNFCPQLSSFVAKTTIPGIYIANAFHA